MTWLIFSFIAIATLPGLGRKKTEPKKPGYATSPNFVDLKTPYHIFKEI
jgi:hypothetical protein